MDTWIENGINLPWIKLNPVLSTALLGLAVVAAFLIWAYNVRGEKEEEVEKLEVPEEAERVGRVSRVALYPLKSGREMTSQESMYCDRMGLRSNNELRIRDRSWMVTLETGTMVTQRGESRMALLQPSISPDGQYFLLDAPGMTTLRVSTDLSPKNSPTLDVNIWGLHSDAVHCGQEASEWICRFLGKKGHILVYHPPSVEGRTINSGPLDIHKKFKPDNKVAFAEMAPILLMSESTVDDVNRRVDQMEVTATNFRPNINVDGSEEPYQEDKWDKVYIGKSLVLENTILAQRCLETTVDPATGIKNEKRDPLETLKRYRPMIDHSPCLGLFMSVLQEGEVCLGDPVWATLKT